MTENETKGFIQGKLDCMNKCDVFDCKGTDECDGCDYYYSQGNFGKQKEALKMAIKVLSEIQQYRAIGTVDECAEMQVQYNYLSTKIKKYEAIGTVEEFKALKEKSEPKKIDRYYCPICRHYFEDGEAHNYCPECGQALET